MFGLIRNRSGSSRSSLVLNAVKASSYTTGTVANKANFGLMLDIDGVLLRGKTLLDSTKDCVKLLTDSKGAFRVPTVFLTNAGNELRSTKALKLSALLGVSVKPDQVIMSHSPLKMLKSFHKKRCLISGQGPIVEIAKNLGFNSLITVDDLRQYYPHLDVVDHKRRSFSVSSTKFLFWIVEKKSSKLAKG